MIESLLNSGKRYSSKQVELYFDSNPTESKEPYSVAFLISGKAGKAVERNRIKRWMREDFRKLQEKRRIDGSFLVRFRGAAKEVNHPQLSAELERLYQSITAND